MTNALHVSLPERPVTSPLLARAPRRTAAAAATAPSPNTAVRDADDENETVRAISEVLHDLRSPLTSILCLCDLLYEQQQRAGDPAGQRQVALIHSAALGMHEMVCDFRDLALRLGGLFEPHAIPFALADVVATVVALLRPTAEEKGLELRVTVPDGAIHVGHPGATKRVLLNLATNALRFTEHGYVAIHVAVADDTLLMTIIDTGSGLPTDVESVLTTDGSWRLRRTGEQGLGVGLSICKQLVGRLGGSIAVDSMPDRGTSIRVELPNECAPRAADRRSVPRPA